MQKKRRSPLPGKRRFVFCSVCLQAAVADLGSHLCDECIQLHRGGLALAVTHADVVGLDFLRAQNQHVGHTFNLLGLTNLVANLLVGFIQHEVRRAAYALGAAHYAEARPYAVHIRQTVAHYENRIRDIDKQAEEILSAARQKALANEADIVAKAKEEAARIIARANAEAELEKKKAADDVKKEMIQIASAMAGKVVAANIDTTVSDGLIDETLKEIGESTWLS